MLQTFLTLLKHFVFFHYNFNFPLIFLNNSIKNSKIQNFLPFHEELKQIEIIILMINKWHHFGSKYLKSYNSTNTCFTNLLLLKLLISGPSCNLIDNFAKYQEGFPWHSKRLFNSFKWDFLSSPTYSSNSLQALSNFFNSEKETNG